LTKKVNSDILKVSGRRSEQEGKMRVYVAMATFGYGEDRSFETVYAGLSEQEARDALKNYHFPDDWQNFSYIDVWENGKIVQHIELP
jgi:hypothetical protein